MMKNLFKKLCILSMSTFALSSHAAVILSSDFSGIDGDVSNVSWVENDVSVTSDLSPFDTSANLLSLFDLNDVFAVDQNIHNESSWYADIALSVSSLIDGIQLSSFVFDASIFNNSGNLQSIQRDLTFSLELLDGASVLFSDSDNVFVGDNNDSGFNPTEAVEFDLSSILLIGGSDYTFRITASGVGGGNNAGFDNLVLNGTSVSSPGAPTTVSAPGTSALLLMSGLAFLMRFRRN
ncbi:hypothetical protein AVL56_07380 [Alteromonas stellipolaris]|uniref:hypothetical protein n=1 Tax=Alteromonas TaxID=226 RepID=UPI00076FF73F|nr:MULTISPECIES: hypothetical protein [Alteromonas]AMJ94147.1 hypothetical protein AVL56_07380 [Alteromonas stellipolaris]WOI36113.1 hypothetical protein R1T43_12900 [Alteromonas sp. CI.11.F.A3]